jgi:DNA-binding MarR family transcriptional regulator
MQGGDVMTHVLEIKEMLNDCLAVRARAVARSLSAVYEQVMASHRLTMAQVNLLASLGVVGPCAPVRLSEVLQLERSTISRNLTLLIDKGLIEVIASDAKGIKEVALTEAGSEKIGVILPDWRAAKTLASQLLGETGVQAIRDASAAIWTPLP